MPENSRHKLPSKNNTWTSKIAAVFLQVLPLRLLSRLFGGLANLSLGKALNPLIRFFSGLYKIDTSEAVVPLNGFKSFNDFFDRQLKEGARTIDPNPKSIVSPVDGTILSFGSLDEEIILEAKGTGSNLEDLLAMPGFIKRFIGGDYLVIYLSPRDYHRIHSPLDANIIGYNHIPGRLYPVNTFAVNHVERLFSTNERLVTFMETGKNKLCALVKVGATNVGSIKVNYRENLKTNKAFGKRTTDMFVKGIPVEKGAEMARFELGSTVILLFEKGMAKLNDLTPKNRVLLGEGIALLK